MLTDWKAGLNEKRIESGAGFCDPDPYSDWASMKRGLKVLFDHDR